MRLRATSSSSTAYKTVRVGNGVTASWNASTDTLTLTGSASLAVYDTLLSEVSYQDTGTDTSSGSHPVRTVTWTVNDGTNSYNTTSQVTIDRAPVVSVANVALNSTTVAASSLFTASDPDGDAITTYTFKDTGNGNFVLNGIIQANNQEIDVTASQLSQLSYQSAGGTDSLQVRVSDGTLWSTWQSFTVTGPVLVDLTEYASMAATTVAAGAATTVDVYTVNRGSVSSGASASAIYLSTDGNINTSDTLLATVSDPALSPNGVAGYVDHHAVSVTLPANLAPGTYYIGAIANYNNQIAESNTSNDASAPVQITVTAPAPPALPDLTEYASMATATVAAGAATTVDVYTVNRGSVTSGASASAIYLSTDGNIKTSDTLLATVSDPALSPNGVAGYVDHHAVSVTLPANLAPGTYYIGAIANYNNQIAESNTSNDASAPVQITVAAPAPPALPDLTEYASMATATVAAGAATTVDVYTVNRGSVTSGASASAIYLSTDGNIKTSDTLLATVSDPALSPNGVAGYVDHHAVSVTLPANLAPGTYYIGAIANYNNQIAESNTSNDASAPIQITVTAPAGTAMANTPNASGHESPTVSDTFVFATNFGQNTINNFDPNHDTITIDHRVFADVAALMAHTSDNSSGNAVIAANAHNTITLGVATEILQHHLHDFIIT